MMNKSIDIQQKIEKYRQEVINIKNNFKKDDINKYPEQIKNMRISHGHAIIDLDEYTKYVSGKMNATPEEFIALSTCTSLLRVIHTNINICEKMAAKNGNSPTSDYNSTVSLPERTLATIPSQKSLSIIPTSKKTITVTTRTTQNGTEELGLNGLSTEINPRVQQAVQNKFVENKSADPSMTEMLDNLESSDIEKLINKSGKQNGGADLSVDKQTLINYWGDWCGWSVKFKPEWDKFVELAKKDYPNLQVLDLHIGYGDSDLNKLADRVGVKGFPKIVLFSNGIMRNMSCGGKEVTHVKDFVDKYYIK